MSAKESSRAGRPRSFDVETALATGQRMFQERGYDGVSLSDLTSELGIAPPSFYSAFGSKAAFFQRALDRYVAAALPIDELLAGGSSLSESVERLLVAGAVAYSADADVPGCLALEATRGCSDAGAMAAARRIAEDSRIQVEQFVARTRPELAQAVADLVASLMHGLSAHARQGWSTERLVAAARNAALAVACLERTRDQ